MIKRRTSQILSLAWQYSVRILFAAAILWLVLLAGFSTSCISKSEHTTFLRDSPAVNLAVSGLMAVLLTALSSAALKFEATGRFEADGRCFRLAKQFLLTLIFLSGVLLVLCLRVIPNRDQASILEAAVNFNNGDFRDFIPGGYAQSYQHQLGIIGLLCLYVRLFGEDNYIVFQLLNAVCLAVIWNELSGIGGLFGVGRNGQLVMLLFGLLFLPFTLYTTFFYGTIPGLAFALAGLRRLLMFEAAGSAEDGRLKLKQALCAVVCLTAACVVKSNYQIFLLAALIFLAVLFVRSGRAGLLGLAAALVCAFLLQSRGIPALFNAALDEPMPVGCASLSWAAMGLQESERANGWYNRYVVRTYEQSGYDAAAQAGQAKSDLADRLAYFAENGDYAQRFFAEKTASQWNNPTWQGDWTAAKSTSEIKRPAWTDLFMEIEGQKKLTAVYNPVQFIVLAGLLFFALCDAARNEKAALLLQMVFVGGFLFHFVWEAKAQYTVVYFVSALPLAVKGWQSMVLELRLLPGRLRTACCRRRVPAFAAGLCAVFLALSLSNSPVSDRLVKVWEETEAADEERERRQPSSGQGKAGEGRETGAPDADGSKGSRKDSGRSMRGRRKHVLTGGARAQQLPVRLARSGRRRDPCYCRL